MSDDFSRLRQEGGVEYLTAVVREKERSAGRFAFIDLYAGIGGMRRGFDGIGGRCAFSSEWDRFSQETYLANFDCEHDIAGDITGIFAADIPEHDVLLAGFPCQPFSITGASRKNALGREHGFRCDAQGTLFFDVARIIEHHRPRAFLLENVKNLISHDRGRTFAVIYRALTEELGYQISCRVLDARRFVPQHRERILIAGFRNPNGFTLEDIDLPDPADGRAWTPSCIPRTVPRNRSRPTPVTMGRSCPNTRFRTTSGHT